MPLRQCAKDTQIHRSLPSAPKFRLRQQSRNWGLYMKQLSWFSSQLGQKDRQDRAMLIRENSRAAQLAGPAFLIFAYAPNPLSRGSLHSAA